MSFELISPDGEDIRFVQEVGAPVGYALLGVDAFEAKTSFGDMYIEKAHEARRLLTADYQADYTITQLSRKLATNPYKLKTTFKHLFGISNGKYKKAAFME